MALRPGVSTQNETNDCGSSPTAVASATAVSMSVPASLGSSRTTPASSVTAFQAGAEISSVRSHLRNTYYPVVDAERLQGNTSLRAPGPQVERAQDLAHRLAPAQLSPCNSRSVGPSEGGDTMACRLDEVLREPPAWCVGVGMMDRQRNVVHACVTHHGRSAVRMVHWSGVSLPTDIYNEPAEIAIP